MSNLRQAAIALLEYLDGYDTDYPEAAPIFNALQAALAEPEQEPVAWMQEMPVSGNEERSVRMTTVKMVADEWDNPIPLYTAPTPRKPLKEDEIADLWDGHTVPVFGKIGINPIVFARAIERAHGISGEQT